MEIHTIKCLSQSVHIQMKFNSKYFWGKFEGELRVRQLERGKEKRGRQAGEESSPASCPTLEHSLGKGWGGRVTACQCV